jgi:glycosyltransferase involved in cell wall biosynthesis
MNIAFVNPEFPSPSGHDQGGIATYTYSMANACARNGHRVHILVKRGTIPKQLSPDVAVDAFDHIPLPDSVRWFSRFINGETAWERGYSWGLRQKLLELHEIDPIDIVEVPEYNGLAYELAPPLPFPIIIHFHTPTVLVDFFNAQKNTRRHKKWHLFEAKALDHAFAFRCPSSALKMEICKRYAIPENRITLIRHPFDTTPFDSIKKHACTQDVIDVLFVGRLERRKGAEILRREILPILSLDPRMRITIAGESTIGDMGIYRNAIERSLSEHDRKRIFFLGPTKREELPALYCRSDIFCIPSLFENAPYSLLEAMAAKLPIIGSRCGGIPELISHGENGLLFNPENPDEIVNCIKQLVVNRGKAAEFARNSYATLKNLCSPDTIARTVIDYYQAKLLDFRS